MGIIIVVTLAILTLVLGTIFFALTDRKKK